MTESIVNSESKQKRTTPVVRYAVLAAILLVLAAVFLSYRAWTTQQAATIETTSERISASELEERYGLRVRLIGVTAAGGIIDFRLKIVDPDKARQFLQDPANLPRLIVAESSEALMGTEELDEDVSWEEGGILFILFSNSGGAIQPGTPVIVEFGGVQLEPIPAQ